MLFSSNSESVCHEGFNPITQQVKKLKKTQVWWPILVAVPVCRHVSRCLSLCFGLMGVSKFISLSLCVQHKDGKKEGITPITPTNVYTQSGVFFVLQCCMPAVMVAHCDARSFVTAQHLGKLWGCSICCNVVA